MIKHFYISFIIIFSLIFAYNVGDYVNIAHQNTDFEICYAPELDPNNDGLFNFAEYSGDLNGGQYHVIFLEMMATW